jgi:DNA-binding NtrC family response regulator
MVADRRILVVDDEPIVTASCRRVLAEAGYKVDTAATGRDGLSRAAGENFDLVVADLRLPDLDGMELVRTLRSKRWAVAVVIITGYGSVPSAVEAMKLGVSEYIQKPFTPEQITEAVSNALGTPKETVRQNIEASLVRKVLRLASSDQKFGQRLFYEGSRVLCGFALSPEAKAAIVSGDIVWVEKECGELSSDERDWLEHRLEAEIW